MDSSNMALSRRDFLRLSALTAGAAAASGCVTNPVTGQSQFMLISASQELALDRQTSPRQFSADYGPMQDAPLTAYIDGVGRKLTSVSHRRDLPYSFRPVNAVYSNAYAFPGGSIAVTRGLLVELGDEAQLAALLGHEIAHVNHRHTAQQMSQGLLVQLAIAGASAYVASEKPRYADYAAGLGGLGGTMLLARYSRDHERQADATGMDYLVRAGYAPQGMVDLMTLLTQLSGGDRPGALETLFATHPMSSERLSAVNYRAAVVYPPDATRQQGREAFLEHTAALRRQKPAIVAFQRGEEALAKRQPPQARTLIEEGLRLLPDDYAGLLLLARVAAAQQRPDEAERLAQRAAGIYPSEAQARAVLAQSLYQQRRYDPALAMLTVYDRMLPGDPTVPFYAGLCHEQLGRREAAADAYLRFLRESGGGADSNAQPVRHAAQRLREWGVIAP